ncbi:hypothetical protein PVAND_015613 [Polypedilum vanderplanki]|uniref:Uncharacterized protein n=1 Tax=Polypedilum vanderplanki TaxID=319348 RepID=A0A9J6BDD6_POLVA|nr:hypothetical protein PVAND_015613 [Polypedilum vanderplanki]
MKIFVTFLAVSAIFVSNSEANYIKCFPKTTPVPTTPAPTTQAPTQTPTQAPTAAPTTLPPTVAPTAAPTQPPTTLPPSTTTTTTTPTTTTTTTTPTTTTTTVPPKLNACAVWTRYLNDDAPATIGFSAGISPRSNTTAYIGRGQYGDVVFPGRVQITTTTNGTTPFTPGVYVPYFGYEWQAPVGEFLVLPQGCSCQWISASDAFNHNGVVYTNNQPLYKFAVGRKSFGNGQVAISRVYLDPTNTAFYMKQYYEDAGNIERSENATEILVCETAASTAGRPVINFPYEYCGVWSSFGMVDSVATNGFNVGTSNANTTLYIGKGFAAAYTQGGRYEPNVGTFVTRSANALAYNSAWLIVPQGCNCYWMAPNLAKARKGLILVGDDSDNFMIGLHTFSTGQKSVTIPLYINNYETYVGLNLLTVYGGYATQILVCENIPPPPQGCALWAAYLDDNAPAINGFYAGNSTINNSPVYVGWGDYGDLKLPARIQITTTSTGTLPRTPGGYVSAGAEVQVTYPEYLVVPNSCSCSWINPSLASSHPGLILSSDLTYNWAIGRKTFTDGTISITKVVMNSNLTNYMKQTYNNAAGVQIVDEPATELLVCETTASTATAPVFTFANEACGVWSTDNMVPSSASNGFAIGQSIFPNITNYVGRGQFIIAQARIGRYQDESPSGAYTPNGALGETIMTFSQWLIVPQGCNCYWLRADQALVRRGLITSSDDTYNFAVSYKNVSATQVSIATVDIGDKAYWEYYSTTANQQTTATMAWSDPLLVCDNLPTPPANPCAYWIRYNGDNGPTVNGFNAGISAYTQNAAAGTTVWIARGMFGNIMIPGRVQMSGTTGTIYITIRLEYPPNLGGGEYLVLVNGCSCSWQPNYLASNHPGLVRTGDNTYDYLISRINSTTSTGISIGKTTTPYYTTDYTKPSPLAETILYYPASPIDVLVCESNSDMSVKPTFNFASNGACGLWTRYNGNNWPASNGFSFGTDRSGNTAYVARANTNAYNLAGRLVISGTPTIYNTYSTEPQGTQIEYLVVPNSCNCTWTPYSAVLFTTAPGLVRTYDFNFQFAIGRVNLGGGKYAISSVKTNGEQWYNDLSGTFIINYTPTELLVCHS